MLAQGTGHRRRKGGLKRFPQACVDEVDREIAAHVLRMHQYRPSRDDAEDEEEKKERATQRDSMYQTNFHNSGKKLFSTSFLKKYITTAKRRKPTLTSDAVEQIAEHYKEIRLKGKEGRTLPVTARPAQTHVSLCDSFHS